MSVRRKFLSFLRSSASMPWYTEVEYLQFNHKASLITDNSLTPCINTGIKNNWDYPMEIVATVSKTLDGTRAIICGNYANNLTMSLELSAENKLRFFATSSRTIDDTYIELSEYLTTAIPSNKPTRVWLKWNPLKDDAHTVTYEFGYEALDGSGTETATGSLYRSGQVRYDTRTLRIGGDYRSALAAFDSDLKVYKVDITNGDVQKRFIPCLDLNRIPSMYEQVEGKVYHNVSNLIDFTPGRRIVEVEWIKLTNQQWFNTGKIVNSLSTTYRTKINDIDVSSQGGFVCGVRYNADVTNSCSLYLSTVVSSAPYGYLRYDWPANSTAERYNLEQNDDLNIEVTGNYISINGVVTTYNVVPSYTPAAPFYIGNTYSSASQQFQSGYTGKLYFGELLDTYTREVYRYCVPAHDENNIGFLFDRVNHFIMDNAGGSTGALTWGEEFHTTEYLYGGTNTQIDTLQFYEGNTVELEAKVDYGTNRKLIGAYAGVGGYIESNNDNLWSCYTSNKPIPVLALDKATVSTSRSYDTENRIATTTIVANGYSNFRAGENVGPGQNQYTFNLFPALSDSYASHSYLWKSRIYNTASKELLQNLIPVKNEQKVGKMLDTRWHKLYANSFQTNPGEFGCGKDSVSYEDGTELPYGYRKLNYLESTGSQFIDTGILMLSTYGVEIEARNTSTTTGKSRYLFGNYDETGAELYIIAGRSGNGKYMMSIGGYYVESDTAYDGKFHVHKVKDKEYFFDGVSYGTSGSPDFTPTHTAYIFQSRGVGFGNDEYQVRYCKIFDESGRIIRNYIPALRTYDNKPGMFDLVTREFLTNSGADEFLYEVAFDEVKSAALDAVAETYTSLTYIESTGTQYITLPIKGPCKVKVLAEGVGLPIRSEVLIGSSTLQGSWYGSPGVTGKWGLTNSYSSGYTGDYNTKSHGDINFTADTNSVAWIDGSRVICASPVQEADYYTLFARAQYVAKCKLYSCKFYSIDDELLYDLIPAMRNSDGRPGLYDVVNKKFYVSEGEDDFLYNIGRGYTAISWLESTGEQYINTGVYMKQNYGVEITARLISTEEGASRYLFGNATTSAERYMLAVSYSGGKFLCDIVSSARRISSSVNAYDGLFHTHKINNGSYYVDGTLQGTAELTEFTPAETSQLFKATNSSNGSKWQIKVCRIWDGDGKLLKTFVPVLRDSDGKPGMYDPVNNVFYTAVGSEFLYDYSVYHKVNYLQSTSAQYFDTGISGGNSQLEILTKLKYSTHVDFGWFYGNWTTDDENATRLGLYNIEDTGLNNANTKANNNGNMYFSLTPNTIHTVVSTYATLKIDGVSTERDKLADGNANNSNICLFNRGLASPATNRDIGAQIYDYVVRDFSQPLLRDGAKVVQRLIPMVRTTDNKPGMFDWVSKKFFVNEGIGEFTYG